MDNVIEERVCGMTIRRRVLPGISGPWAKAMADSQPVMNAASAALVLQCNAWFAAKMYDAGWMTAEEAKMFGVQPDENRP